MTRGVAIVTGAGRGVGRATAERLARGGYVVVTGVRDLDRAREEYGKQPGIQLVQLDVTNQAHIDDAVALAEDFAGGPIDVLVNNAGHAMMGAQENGDLQAARAMFETNLWGAAAMVQAVVPGMRAAGRGTVVTVSSIGARLSNPLVGFYHGSKYALSAFSEALAAEAGHFGVRVIMIEPGMINTDFPKATVLSDDVTDPGSPYAPLFTDLRAGFGAWRERDDASTAESCAEVIWDAINMDDPPMRIVVGEDAEELDRYLRESADDHEFQQHLRAFLKLDWPPVPPRT